MAFFSNATVTITSGSTLPHMTFLVGGQLYGIPMDKVSEVVALDKMAPLCTADPAVVGEIELRGSALVIVDMGIRLLGKAISPGSKSCILIVQRAAARSGCLFEAPDAIVNIPPQAIELSGCLVAAADKIESIPQTAIVTPENTSASGKAHGWPLYRTGKKTILLPESKLFYPL